MCIKVYISGKVSGLSEAEYTDKFAKAEAILQFKGFETINPVQVVNDAQASWEDAMKLCINALLSCNAVFALPCALESRGARIEIELATELGIPVFESLNHLSLHYL